MWSTTQLLIATILIAVIIPLSEQRLIQTTGGMGSAEVQPYGRHENHARHQRAATLHRINGAYVSVDVPKAVQSPPPTEPPGSGWSSTSTVPPCRMTGENRLCCRTLLKGFGQPVHNGKLNEVARKYQCELEN